MMSGSPWPFQNQFDTCSCLSATVNDCIVSYSIFLPRCLIMIAEAEKSGCIKQHSAQLWSSCNSLWINVGKAWPTETDPPAGCYRERERETLAV